MEPLNFPEANNKLAKSQPQYRPLPVYIAKVSEGTPSEHFQFTGKYELSDLEIQQIIKTKSFYFSQFGSCFHPILPQVENAFGVCRVEYKKIDDQHYSFWIPLSDGNVQVLNNIPIELSIIEIMSWANLKADEIYFIEKLDLGVDKNGNIVGL